MKIRLDFVTNSSSSSFVVFKIQSKTFSEIMKKYFDDLQERFSWCHFVLHGEYFEAFMDEFGCCVPREKEELMDAIVELFEEVYDEDDDMQDTLVSELEEHKEDIENDMDLVELEYTDVGWGGDSDIRYDMDMFEEEYVQAIKEIIAEEKGYEDVSEVDQSDWDDYVGDKQSFERERCEYDVESGEFNYYRDVEIE